jgi:hypothetical protein
VCSGKGIEPLRPAVLAPSTDSQFAKKEPLGRWRMDRALNDFD